MRNFTSFTCLFFLILFVSCKKNYICECYYGGVNATYDLGKLKKKEAKSACEAKGESIIAAGGTCEVKEK